MPFPENLPGFQNNTNNHILILKKAYRKEAESGYTHLFLSCLGEKASASAFRKEAVMCSITVEAVLCVPLFLYAAVCLIWMLELRAIQISICCALQETGKQLAMETADIPFLIPAELEADMRNAVGEARLERSLITGGIHCEGSYIWPLTGIMELSARYQVRIPFSVFAIPPLEYEETMRIKAWNGYVKSGFSSGSPSEEIVYVTETGVVYHKDYHCSYLEPSVRGISAEQIGTLRNESGEKYYPCSSCGKKEAAHYYITDYGNKYHSSLSCSGIKRKIFAVPISEAKGKGVCSKCGR